MKISYDEKSKIYTCVLSGKVFSFSTVDNLIFFFGAYIDGFFRSKPTCEIHVIYKGGKKNDEL